jgi:type II secretory pathway predicted ATPase ExeA
MHEPLRQRIAVQYHLEGLSREELDSYLAHQLKAAGVSQPLFDDTARQALYQATKGIPRKVNQTGHDRPAPGRRAQSHRGE